MREDGIKTLESRYKRQLGRDAALPVLHLVLEEFVGKLEVGLSAIHPARCC
jgi:hypothetical protein